MSVISENMPFGNQLYTQRGEWALCFVFFQYAYPPTDMQIF